MGDSAPSSANRSTRTSFGELLGESAAMREVFGLLERLAPTELAIFIEGPTGSGKELVARAIHEESARKGKPFVVLDCTSLPATLAESVLFGHAAGSFTGANEAREGVFEAADGGTVFIDEIGDLPLDLQPKLLRVLERREVTRVGENRPRTVSVRIVSATWRDLGAMVGRGQFRSDLFYRLAQTRVVLPKLAERRDDIPLLASALLERGGAGSKKKKLSREAMDRLVTHDFPGNVRELKNTIERAAFMCDGAVIGPGDLSFDVSSQDAPPPSSLAKDDGELPEFKAAKRLAVESFERAYLERLMNRTQGNIAMAAGLAGIERHYLRALLKKHGLHSRE